MVTRSTEPTPTAPTPEVHATTLLAGDAASFTRHTWATRMHLHRGDPDVLGALLTLSDVDDLVTTTGIRTPAIRLARDGDVLPASCFTTRASLAGRPLTGLVHVRRVLEQFDAGATIVLQGLHRSWPPLTHLVARLERELGHPGQANAYLTPPGSRGFDVHADSHDVFVVQTHGTKLWEVHDDDRVHEIRMEPGTCLYLPLGTRHAARTTETASLHVTIGIRPVTWRQVLTRTVTSLLDDMDDDGDSRLPAGWTDRQDDMAVAAGDRLQQVARALTATDPAAMARDEADRFLVSRPTSLAGGLADLLDVDEIDDTTLVRRRPGHVLQIRDGEDQVRLLLGDRELTVPGWIRPAVDHLVTLTEFRPADLAGSLDRESRCVLVRRLVREGLLQVVA